MYGLVNNLICPLLCVDQVFRCLAEITGLAPQVNVDLYGARVRKGK